MGIPNFMYEVLMQKMWLLVAGVLTFTMGFVAEHDPPEERYWPQWRGPVANGVAPHANPPLSWSETENVNWKIEIPGKGSATPIIWEDRIFVLSAVPTGKKMPRAAAAAKDSPKESPDEVQQYTVLAIRRDDGSLLWKRVVREAIPHEGTHATNNWAACSPVTDGERVYAFFGSQGLYCLSLDGEMIWQKDLGGHADPVSIRGSRLSRPL